MTLPIQTLCGDNSSKLPLRGGGEFLTTTTTTTSTTATTGGRRKNCLSAAWADPPVNNKKERRRAIYSWSVGYGTLTEFEETIPNINLDTIKKGKVADNATLLEPRGRRPQAVVTNSIALPHAASPTANRRLRSKVDFLAMPGIKTFVHRRRNSGTSDPQVPLVSGKNPTANGSSHPIRQAASLANLKKCETVLALTGVLHSSSSSNSLEPLQPINRLRTTSKNQDGSLTRLCSRCSSLLTLASTSRYSINSSTGGFIPVIDESKILCKLCLAEVPCKNAWRIEQCDCAFCIECMKTYVEFEIAEGAYDISCPDAQCPTQGVLQQHEIKRLAGNELLEKHKKYRLNREIELDKSRLWCPRAGCETVCNLCPSQKCIPQSVHCPTCTTDFCSNCKLEWHPNLKCDEYNKQLAKEGKADEPGIPFDSDLIKCCPMCNVPIEKDEGCAQMMCKRCKHVFCWYCLASLDDDFLLRHYDKGPCKNKLGHSRASVIWHRTQVIGIFAGFGILLLVASPLLLLAAPCIVCCKCRVCNAGTTKLDNEDDVPVDES